MMKLITLIMGLSALTSSSLGCGDASSSSGQAQDSSSAAEAAVADAIVGDAAPDATAPGPDAAATDGAETEMLTVLDFNLFHDFPSFSNIEQRTRMVADVINSIQPDFVTLQEAGQSPMLQNRAQVLAGMTGYRWAWQRASGTPTVFEEGPAILSKWPLEWSAGQMLPHDQFFGLAGRAVVGVRAQTPYGPIQVFSTHLTTQSDPTIVNDQAEAAYRFMTDQPTDMPEFLGGDMNSNPDETAMRFLRGEVSLNGVTSTLHDAWMSAEPSLPGLTDPSNSPRHRIDYLYFAPGQARVASAADCQLMFTQPVGGVYASDHLGVLCHFVLR